MYENLRKELNNKGITHKAVASMIGCSEKTMQNKLSGKTDFLFKEVMSIRNDLLPEFTIEYLFSQKN